MGRDAPRTEYMHAHAQSIGQRTDYARGDDTIARSIVRSPPSHLPTAAALSRRTELPVASCSFQRGVSITLGCACPSHAARRAASLLLRIASICRRRIAALSVALSRAETWSAHARGARTAVEGCPKCASARLKFADRC